MQCWKCLVHCKRDEDRGRNDGRNHSPESVWFVLMGMFGGGQWSDTDGGYIITLPPSLRTEESSLLYIYQHFAIYSILLINKKVHLMISDPEWWTWGAQPPSWLLIVERFSDSSFRPSTFLTIYSTTHEKLKTQQEKHSSLKNSITFQCLGEFCLFFKVIPFCLSAPFAATLIHSFVNKKNFQPRVFSLNNILLFSSFGAFMSTRILPYRSYHHLH